VAVPRFVEKATPLQWRAVFETNLFGQATVTRCSR
jgi:NAD(P)-dependent dehydrogenase (short-subunit alcohol dehydrogenase family)